MQVDVSPEDVRELRASGLLDEAWYKAHYLDVVMLGMDPASHYLSIGARLQRDPGPNFSCAHYLGQYADVAQSGMNPVLHYLRHGRQEGRDCLPPERRPKVARVVAERARPSGLPDTYRTYGGRMERVEGARTVLVCAHVMGAHLFGGERSLLDIVEGLTSAGYNVVVATPGIGNVAYLRALRDRTLAVVSFRYGWWRNRSPVDESVIATFAHVIAEHGIDAVHANTIMLREPLLAARRMEIPAVVHVRELIEHDTALCELIGESADEIVDDVLASSDWVIANSEATARAFAKEGTTSVIPNTVDLDAFKGVDVRDGAPVRIGMVSSNLPKKGILDFVAVARLVEQQVPDAQFVLIGPENDHTRALMARREHGEVPANLVVAGYRDDPAKAMEELDILLNLSHFQESFGRTVLEAMAARRPVVVYDWGALPELVVEGETGHVVPFRDVDAVAQRVAQLCQDHAARRRMGEAGHARAQARYTKPLYAGQLREAYGHIFTGPDGGERAPGQRLVLPARNGAGQAAQEPGRRLRIAYFLWHFPVPSETFVLNELRVLAGLGFEVQVFCRQSPYKDFQPDFPVTWARVADPAELAAKLREHEIDVVHSHFTFPTVTQMVWPACEMAGVPFTFIAHAQDIFRYSNDEKNQIGEIGRSPMCLRVVVPSRFHRDYVEQRGVPAHKIFINPNGVDPELYADGVDAARPARTRRSICAIHRFTAKKGLEHLILAGRELARDGVSIHLYGYGELEENYRATIAAEGLANVHLHGAVKSREDMLEVFGQHDLFACPSVRAADGDMDGIPTVLMEAMAAGLPVLTTAISGIPDLVQDGLTGVICEATPEDIVRAVRGFYAMSDLQVAAMIQDARELIVRDYHVARLTANLLRLWQGRTVDVVIVSWNNVDQLREVITRLYRFTSLPFHLIVCDNGSRPDVVAYLSRVHAEHDNVTVVLNRQNAYVGPGTNICLEHGRSDYAVYVCGKEGFVLEHGWERSLLEYMDAHPQVGLGGTLCHSPSYLTGAQYPTAIPEFPRFRNREFATNNPDRRFAHVQGGFFIIRRAMFDQIGGFSLEVPHNYTDVEYSYFAESCGWQLGSPPRLLALFNKTRPGLASRISESALAVHPPTLEELPLLDRIAARATVHCNVCGWHGECFDVEAGEAVCAQCRARPADRTLYRFLAESCLTYRRLPALGVGVGEAMQPIWRQQFQGQVYAGDDLADIVRKQGRLAFRASSLKLAYLQLSPDAFDTDVLAEVARVLAPDAMLLARVDAQSAAAADGRVQALVDTFGLADVQQVRYSSSVVRYDSVPLLVGRRIGVERCVS